MPRITLYRSLASACIAGALILGTGCDDMGKTQSAMQKEQYDRWNLTRVGVMLQLAQQQYEVGDYDKCRKTIDEAMATHAPSAPLHTLAAKVEIEKGSLEAAAAHLEEAARLDPGSPEPFYLLGVVYQRWQKSDVAADYYQQAWDRKPGEALYMLAVVEMKISLGKLDDAQKILESKEVYFEQSAALRIALGRIAGLRGDHALACKHYRDAVILMPDDHKVRQTYAEELCLAGKYNDAAAIFEDMRKDATGADKEGILLMLAECDLNIHRPLDARNDLQEVVRDNANDTVAYLMLAKTCIQTNDLGIAIASVHKVLTLEPDNSKAMVLNAVIQQRQRNWADSRITLEKALKISPSDPTILCMIGRSAEELGKKDEAAAFYQKAIDADPKDTWAAQMLDRIKPASIAPTLARPEPAASAQPVEPQTTTASENSVAERGDQAP